MRQIGSNDAARGPAQAIAIKAHSPLQVSHGQRDDADRRLDRTRLRLNRRGLLRA